MPNFEWLKPGEQVELVSKPSYFRTGFLMVFELAALLSVFIWLIAYGEIMVIVAIELLIMLLIILTEFAPIFRSHFSLKLTPIFDIDRAMATYYFTDEKIVRATFLFLDTVPYNDIKGAFYCEGWFQQLSGIQKVTIEPREKFLFFEIYSTRHGAVIRDLIEKKIREIETRKNWIETRRGLQPRA